MSINLFFSLGMLYFILCIYNYNGYKTRTQFSRLSEITSLVNSAIFLLLTFVILEFVFNLDNFLLNSDFLSKIFILYFDNYIAFNFKNYLQICFQIQYKKTMLS